MSLMAGVALLGAKDTAQMPEVLGPMDMLLLLSETALPMSIKDATENREKHQKREKVVAQSREIANLIIKGTEHSVKEKAKAAAVEEFESMAIRSTLAELLPLIGTAIGTVISTVVGLIASTVTFVVTSVMAVLGSTIAFLIANPVVAIALAIGGLALWGYHHFFVKKDGEQSEADKNIHKVEEFKKSPDLPTVTAEPAPVAQTSAPVVAAKEQAPEPKTSPVMKAKELVAPAPPTRPAPAQAPETKASAVRIQGAADKKSKKAVISAAVADALKYASTKVGVPLNLLTAMAGVESSFRSDATPPKGSASGLFQFLDSTWKGMISKYGKMYGVDKTADKLDPVASAVMAAAMMKHEGYPAALKASGSSVSITDIYLTHFLGAGGGATFIKHYQNEPDAEAASFASQKEIDNNYTVFYSGTTARSFRQIYEMFAGRLGRYEQRTAEISTPPTTAVAPPKPQAPATTKVAQASPSSVGGSSDAPYEPVKLGKNQPTLRLATGAQA